MKHSINRGLVLHDDDYVTFHENVFGDWSESAMPMRQTRLEVSTICCNIALITAAQILL